MAESLIQWIEPIQARRKEYEADPVCVIEILKGGSKKARKAAGKTMRRVREAVFGEVRGANSASASAAKTQAATGTQLDHTLPIPPPRNLRRPARPPAGSDPQAGNRHPRHPHRQNHGTVSRLSAPAGAARH